ncbi:MFS transporter [Klenkia brasiliensis]|uniref:Predicted arabinose efflux permease, MFS family n=1 Tax=Klenkia brasiliensis TaxID=333142 RepID=A0A1G7Q0P4_9ACTN|nr:MFS transporter [Klenkia brasiliensis]SDF92074.1 Predicted arabinose efflux permease, MFS family [Klenkia brasiliensis]
MPGYRSLVRNRDFTVLWVGETISALGSRMSLFVFPLLTYGLTGSAVQAAAVEAAYLVGTVAALLPAGVLADRLHRRRLMLGSSATGAVSYSSLAVAGATGHLTVGHLAVVAGVVGVAAGVFGPAQLSAVRSVVRTEDLPTALSQNEAREHLAGLLGGPLGGLLFAVTRWLPFAVNALTFAVSCLTLSQIRTDLSAPDHPGPRPRVGADLAEGVRFVLARPFFRVLLTWAALVNLALNALLFVVVLRLVDEGAHPAEIGLVNAAAGVGGIVGAVAAPWLIARVATGRLTVALAWTAGLPLVPLLFWAHPAVAAAALFAVLLLLPASNAGIAAYRIAITPASLQGRVDASSTFLSMAVMPLAPLLGGLALEHLGGRGATVVLLVALLGTALVVTLSREVRSVPVPRLWPSATAQH